MDKRRAIRVPFHVRAVVKFHESIIEGEVENISTGGMLLKTKKTLPEDSGVEISLLLYGSSSNLSLSIGGKVIRMDDSGIGIDFTDVDMDAFIHLRNIVASMAFDEKKIIEDFEASDDSLVQD